MKKIQMSKRLLILALVGALFFVITVCLIFINPNPIEEINNNSVLPFPLTMPERELKYGSEYVRSEGYGGYTLSKEGIFFWVSGWPDNVDDYHLTEYRFTSSEYNVFGITIGDYFESAVPLLEKYQYRLAEKDSDFQYIDRTKKAAIALYHDENGIIYEIWITAIATNKMRVAF